MRLRDRRRPALRWLAHATTATLLAGCQSEFVDLGDPPGCEADAADEAVEDGDDAVDESSAGPESDSGGYVG